MATKLKMSVAAELGQKHAGVVQRLQMAGRTDMKPRMAKAIRKRSAPAIAAVRASFQRADLPASPSRGGGRSSKLRARTARAVGVVTTGGGLTIRVQGNKVDPQYGTSLVLALNGLVRLRHPVFGNRAKWVSQRGSAERFYSSLDKITPQWRADVEQVMDDIVKEIES